MTTVIRLQNEGVCFFFRELIGGEVDMGGPGLDVDVADEELSMLKLF